MSHDVLGYVSLHLHAHLPFVRHPEYEDFLEEDWLYEAISETYLPLLKIFDRLTDEGIPFRISMTMTPPLVAMLRDELLMARYARRLDSAVRARGQGGPPDPERRHVPRPRAPLPARVPGPAPALQRPLPARPRGARSAGSRTRGGSRSSPAARPTASCRSCSSTPRRSGRRSRSRRRATGATSARIPPASGCRSAATTPGSTRSSPSRTSATSSSTRTASPTRRRARATACTRRSSPATGPAAFARDPESSMQVWSAESGYPGDPDYREFYRDVGWDLDYDYVKPYIQPTGQRKNVGIKYYRITGKTAHKEPYDPGRARERAASHAGQLHVQPRAADRAPRLADGRSAADRGLAVRRGAVRSLVVRGADVHRLPRPQGRLRPARVPAGDAGRLPAARTRSSSSRPRRSAPGARAATRASGSTARTTGSTATCTRRRSG